MFPLFADSAGWTDALLIGVLGFAVRATVLLCAAWVATGLLRRASAATRHLVWSATIAGILLLPLLQAFAPAWTVPIISMTARFDAPMAGAASSMSDRSESPGIAPSSVAPTTAPAAPTPETTISFTAAPNITERIVDAVRGRLSVTSLLALLWLTLATLLLARLAIANVRVSYWQRSSRPVEDPGWLGLVRRLSRDYGIERPVMLLENEETDVPVTWGIVYPVVLLPSADAEQWDADQRVAVLTHELAHVKRFDALTQLLGQMVLALLWFHPLVWMAVRRMRLEREHACDDFVLVTGARASRYADDLLGFARRLTRPTAPAAAALAMARRSELEGRLLAILDPGTKRTAVRRAGVGVLTLGVVVLAIPLAAFRPGVRVQSAERPSERRAAIPTEAATAVTSGGPDAGALESRARISASPNQMSAFQQLTNRLDRMDSLSIRLRPAISALARTHVDTEPPRIVDLETLIDVTNAAKRMTSDYEKGELLALIAKHYQRSDALRDAYLDAVMTMTSDHERSQALMALLDRDSLPLSAIAKVLRSTAMMTSDVNKGMVLKRISPAVFADTSVQRAYLDAIVAMTSDVERGGAISSLVKQRPLTPSMQLALLQAMIPMTSDVEKANVLLLFLDRQGIADEKIRRTFFKVAETMTSDTDYRRVMTAVMK